MGKWNENASESIDRELADALTDFCECVEALGGVLEVSPGVCAPDGAEDWTDLGASYLRACAALGRDPLRSAEE